ncbi:OmpA-like domain-containing protein [Methylorubrum aminovorans]
MRMTRSLLLAGTMLPALVLSDLSLARSLGDGGRIELAQREDDGEGPRGGGRGPGGPGAPGGAGPAERGGVERGGPPARERPDRPERPERPEPRQAPAGRERPEPAERPARPERPAPQERQERPERPPAPAQRPDRSEERPTPPAARERTPDRETPARREAPEREAPARRDAPDRPDRDGADRPARPAGRDRDTDRPDTAPSQRRAPEAPTPPSSERPTRPTPPSVPNPSAPETAPNQRPGVPGRPVAPNAQQPARPDQPTPPTAAQPDAAREAPGGRTAPNQQPGVPGRPVQPPGTPTDSTAPTQLDRGSDQRGLDDRRDGERRDGDRRGDRFDRRDDDRRDDDRRGDRTDRRDRFNVPGTPAYVPGGFRDDDYRVRDYDTIRRDRREYDVDGRTYYREPGRIIVRDRDTTYIRHDENERFRTIYGERGYRSERRGGEIYSYVDSPSGGQIITVVDDDGRLLRRSRRYRDGREVILINNAYGGAPRPIYEDVVELPPPDIRIPRDRYVVDYDGADARTVYEALSAPPVQKLDRRYTLDQVRYSPQLRARMPSVDINTITFDTGSFTVTPDQAKRLSTIAEAINRTIKDNPQEVFLIEGYTDAVGSDIDNLSLSDRRAQSVAAVLTQNFQVPPENLTTQGYGEQYLKVNTQEANRENRRVTVRRITPLLQQQAEGQQPAAPR